MNKKRGRRPKAEPLPDRVLLKVFEVAQYFNVCEKTVRNWIEHGLLKTECLPGDSQKRITKESVDAWRFKMDSRN